MNLYLYRFAWLYNGRLGHCDGIYIVVHTTMFEIKKCYGLQSGCENVVEICEPGDL
jgi:hypothetical protein